MTAAGWDDLIVVGRIARTHGLKGQVVVNPETDFADDRFRPGRVMYTLRDGEMTALTVEHARFQQGRPIVTFAGVATVDDAEALGRGDLRMPVEALSPPPDGMFFHRQLVGCVVVTDDGESLGEVRRVEGEAASSRLVVAGRRGEVLIPLADEICRTIDVERRRIVVSPPEGLLDLNR